MGGTGSAEAAQQTGKPTLKRILKVLGPGLVTGASDDDPSGIGTYSQSGASLGFGILWLALWTLPLIATVQYICAKIGLVSGRGLAGVLRENYPRKLLYPVVVCLIVANVINAGVDLGAIGAALHLLIPIPITILIIPVTIGILLLQIFGSYRLIAKVFKWLTLALFAYIGAAFFARPDLGEVLRSLIIPTFSLDKTFLATVVAILGTTISPYLFFWQASQEVEEEVSMGRKQLWQRKGATNDELTYAAWDVNIGMFFSNLVMFFIILATASTLHTAGKTDIQTATDAAEALRPLAGDMAGVLLAVGLVGAGILAVPVLTGSAAYAVAEAFGWHYGLDRKPQQAKRFYLLITGATVIGMLINYLGINPIQALFWTGVINGFIAVPLLAIIMLVANNHDVMGKRVNSRMENIIGWLTVVIMGAAAISLVLTWNG
ncbi:MAG: Nramp family divalent metal transporter [Anaerolineae bacterium]|nr:Nramp family divalent metal transporter [Anaerolineae bacterium]